MFKSTRRFDCAYNGQRYAIGSNVDIELQSTGGLLAPPKIVVCKAETQEVLEYLYSTGMPGIIKVEDVKVFQAKEPKEFKHQKNKQDVGGDSEEPEQD